MISDSPASATEVTLPQPIEGTLDDERDFDYFRFQPVTGQRFAWRLFPWKATHLLCACTQRREDPLRRARRVLRLP